MGGERNTPFYWMDCSYLGNCGRSAGITRGERVFRNSGGSIKAQCLVPNSRRLNRVCRNRAPSKSSFWFLNSQARRESRRLGATEKLNLGMI
ncbi:hypothetical protein CEXT_410971 [Caerostris extrusa]|uniref:Uncharacterized protein n=1 Tax=Caerostris extrusa TaxID=172846 RepID=A0AAV4V5B8_CAEEX|nr:hypothetical protein CEXT_410971 [Caerostris extrusa]